MSSFIMYFPLVLQFITCFVVIDERCLYKETFTNFVTYIDLYVDVLFLDMCRAGHHLVVLIDSYWSHYGHLSNSYSEMWLKYVTLHLHCFYWFDRYAYDNCS